MTVKHLYKRINRGIVLGIILLIGLTAYIWKNESDFKKEMPAIAQTITSYVEESAAADTFSQDLQKAGVQMNEQQQAEKLEEYTRLFNQYWTESDLNDHYAKKSDILQKVQELITGNSKGIGYVRKSTAIVADAPTVKKSGPYDATAEVQYNLVVEYVGSPYIMLQGYDRPVNNLFKKTSDSGDSTTPMRRTIQVNSTMKLSRINGEWKIAGSSGGYGGSDPVAIEE